MRSATALICCLIGIAACTAPSTETPSTLGVPTSTTSTSLPPLPESTAPPSTNNIETPCLSDGAALASDGFLGRYDSDDTDSQALANVNWSDSGDCAALTLSFRSDSGAPAVEPPSIRAVYLRHTAVVRLELGESVTQSALSEQALDTEHLRAIYVAYDPSLPGLVVDVHLAVGSSVRFHTASSPARVVIEFESDGQLIGSGATITDQEVVLVPASTSPPIVVAGYGLSGSTLDVSVVSLAGSVSDSVVLAASPTRWTVFDWTVSDVAVGPVEVRVGSAPTIEFLSP